MREEEFLRLKEWFLQYTNSFLVKPNADKENILLKKEHTLRVCHNMEILSVDLKDGEKFLALTIALLHDVGRFEQLHRYNTFSDMKSEDHASLGIKVLRDLDVLDSLHSDIKNTIIIAIENHNKALISTELSEKQLMFSQMVRDADKLDIWEVVIGYYKDGSERLNPSLVHNLPPGEDINPVIFESVKNREIIKYEDLKSVIDFKILQMAWIYDINSQRALELAINRGYLLSIYDTLPKTDSIEFLWGMLNKYKGVNSVVC